MEKPKIAGNRSIKINVEKGREYWWCACGHSKRQPFCDGSHRATEFTPILYVAESDELVSFCSCKQSGKKPLCDGRHREL